MASRAVFGDAFDRTLGVDTANPVYTSRLGADFARNYWYEATPVSAFQHLVNVAGIDFSRYCFIDLGCGKGRPLLLAASLPFRRIIGVERSPELCAIARRNIERLDATQRRRCAVICADAAQFAFPSGPLLLYLYNPFGVEVLESVLGRLRESLDREPRDVMIVYLNSVHADILRSTPWLRRTCTETLGNEQAGRQENAEIFVLTSCATVPGRPHVAAQGAAGNTSDRV